MIKYNYQQKENNPMGNITDEFLDEFYATTCPTCHENSVDEYEGQCGYCTLNELENDFNNRNEDVALEMSLGLDY